MSKKEKLLQRLLSVPKDFTYEELVSLLAYYGFRMITSGKTSGSAVKFINQQNNMRIYLHKPHPGNVLKKYVLMDIIDILEKGGCLNEQ